jgi:hypothetical protein
MAPDRPSVEVETGFSCASVVFDVRVTNPTSRPMRNLVLRPTPVPEGATVDRARHLIPMLGPKRSKAAQFRLRPRVGQDVVALDVAVEWEGPEGTGRGRLETSSEPVGLALPELRAPRSAGERWRSELRGGPAVEVRVRVPSPTELTTRAIEEAAARLPGEVTSAIEEGPEGPVGTVRVRAEGAKGLRAGLLVEVAPERRRDGSRVLVVASATTDALLTRFYMACLAALGTALPGMEGRAPVSLMEEP